MYEYDIKIELVTQPECCKTRRYVLDALKVCGFDIQIDEKESSNDNYFKYYIRDIKSEMKDNDLRIKLYKHIQEKCNEKELKFVIVQIIKRDNNI